MAKALKARDVALDALLRIERDGGYSDIVLSQILAHSKLAERDRAFVSELVRGVVRWKGHLEHLIVSLFRGEASAMPLEVNLLLKAALYQIIFMRTPDFAAVNECIEMIKERRLFAWSGVANGLLRSYLRRPEAVVWPDGRRFPAAFLAVKYSHPEWLVERWLKRYGFQATEKLCEANNRIPSLSVRINRLRISCGEFYRRLEQLGARFEISRTAGFVRISEISDEGRRQLLHEGLMTVQDESAGLIGRLTASCRGSVVVDLCAAPGGKATQLAEEMLSAGVVAGDAKRRRARLVVEASRRLGLSNLHTVVADAAHFPLRRADVVLLDAPCSGFGVIRKKPDIKWKRSAADITQLAALQKKLILQAADLTSIGGSLVYSTCTIEPEENEEIIESLLRNKNFEPVSAKESGIPEEFVTPEGYLCTLPHIHDMDGAFAAKLIMRR